MDWNERLKDIKSLDDIESNPYPDWMNLYFALRNEVVDWLSSAIEVMVGDNERDCMTIIEVHKYLMHEYGRSQAHAFALTFYLGRVYERLLNEKGYRQV